MDIHFYNYFKTTYGSHSKKNKSFFEKTRTNSKRLRIKNEESE